MKVCEVCGSEEEMEMSQNEEWQLQAGVLHVCEHCRTDRQLPSFDEE